MNSTRRPSGQPKLAELALAFMVLSLSGFGGVGAQARYHLVTLRGWLTDREFADAFGLSQILPGANIANVCVMVGDRFAGPVGAVVCLAALCLPSLVIAVGLMLGAIELTAAVPRFAAVEWTRARGAYAPLLRIARLSISLATLVLIVVFRLSLPLAIVTMLALSVLLERRVRA